MKLSRVAAFAQARAVPALGASEPPRKETEWPRDTVTLSTEAQEHLDAAETPPSSRPRLQLLPRTEEIEQP
jgi:hypothetical protein